MEEKKEMTLFERLNANVDEFEEAEREKIRKALEEQREAIEKYIETECLLTSMRGGYRRKFSEGEKVSDKDIRITIKDVVDFVNKDSRFKIEFYGNEEVEVIWRKGRPQFYEEPVERIPTSEENVEEPSAESATEAIEKMVAGMTKKPKSGEDDDETAEKDLMGPLSEEETADVVGRLRRATSERQAEASEENYSFDTGV